MKIPNHGCPATLDDGHALPMRCTRPLGHAGLHECAPQKTVWNQDIAPDLFQRALAGRKGVITAQAVMDAFRAVHEEAAARS